MKQIFSLATLTAFTTTTARGARYTFDGVHMMNAGELKECLTKAAFGFEAKKDASTPFYKSADIEALNMSVKSADATIPHKGERKTNVNDYADAFTADDVATCYAYAIMTASELIIYTMSKIVMNKLIKRFGTFRGDCVRLPKDSELLKKWLDINAKA